MRSTAVLALAAAGVASARPHIYARQNEENPFSGKQLYVNPSYSGSLNATRDAFIEEGDLDNAGKVRFVQERVGSFVWIPNIASVENIDEVITNARAAKEETGQDQIIGLVLYNLPDRDCSAGESAGELSLEDGGMERYKAEYVDPFAERVLAAPDLSFAVVLEPDAVGNIVTNGGIPFCENAAPHHEDGIAYAIQQLSGDHVALYIDASHGGWLGWDDNLAPTAATFARIVEKAGPNSKIRGYSTNVSNYNSFKVDTPPDFTEGSNSYDESNYALQLQPHLEAEGLPAHFIIDQGRVALEGAREEWGEWCNVAPSAFGQPATTDTDNPVVDAVVWVKPGGESDGECGLEGAPIAGAWFNAFAKQLTENAHEDIIPLDIEEQ